ncbi:MAG: hypothetical protein ACREUG_11540, partial [Steroidobacteraceae bacterium]
LYVLLTGTIAVDLLIVKPRYTWPGLIIVALGIPVYYAWRLAGQHKRVPKGAEATLSRRRDI